MGQSRWAQLVSVPHGVTAGLLEGQLGAESSEAGLLPTSGDEAGYLRGCAWGPSMAPVCVATWLPQSTVGGSLGEISTH